MDDETSSQPSQRKPRIDGVQARERTLAAALNLFVARGYHNTSVRDIAAEANVNSASIRYYFGDKVSLYRAALYEPMQSNLADESAPFDAPGLSVEEAMYRYTRKRLQPLGQGPAVLLSVRLRMREVFEPTGLLDDERYKLEQEQRLLNYLATVLGAAAPDADIVALGYSIRSLTAYPYTSREQHYTADTGLLDLPAALEDWTVRLANYACAILEVERRRRAQS